MAQMLTANRLIDGTVLYWKDGGWSEAFGEGEVFADAAAAKAALAAAGDFVARNKVINPYLFDLKDGRPAKEREIIRALGPSVRADLGKQADGIGFGGGHFPPPGSLRSPTSPQGGGGEDSDVSI